MKRCSTSHVIRESQVKTTMIYYYISIQVAKIQNNNNIKYGRVWEAIEVFSLCGNDHVIANLDSVQFLTKLNF